MARCTLALRSHCASDDDDGDGDCDDGDESDVAFIVLMSSATQGARPCENLTNSESL